MCVARRRKLSIVLLSCHASLLFAFNSDMYTTTHTAARAETNRWDILQTNGRHTYPPSNAPLEPPQPPPLFQVNLVPPDEEGGRPKFEVTLGPPKIRTSSPNGKYAMSPWESIQPEYGTTSESAHHMIF